VRDAEQASDAVRARAGGRLQQRGALG
jgi:hypothetical protein